MKITIYLDVFLITNTLINYFLLKFVCVVCGENPGVKRLVLSSIIGSVLSLSVFFDMGVPAALTLKVLSILFCCFVTFGCKTPKRFVTNLICLLTVYAVFGGIISAVSYKSNAVYTNNYNYYININPLLLGVCIGFMYLLTYCIDVLAAAGNKKYSLIIEITGNKYRINAFYDTGFKVKDIVNRRKVILCGTKAFEMYGDTPLYKDIKNLKNFDGNSDFTVTPIFYSALGKDGILPAFMPDKVSVLLNGREILLENTAVAVADIDFGDDIQAIFGKDIFNMIGG